ncbi:uncharacterized protein MYCFIDRAFT_178228 [Pseudocercospora fijiensis CIRAD86]|uniref:Uncharacterized protein n=1 Tax=Pseudocercospora fijiensis (strain CIRAD86) TaxID=383855 RepID=M2YPH0_PSEFD|nr:uncharacterized protein MYCFIDRAFT_178228 [Pseudocercospora fijiensis CIRAD86]EME79645.1 hypothetical protein MYCFIDRAFT_178228 [Pseudocercospora fijiensis CIRAD86]
MLEACVALRAVLTGSVRCLREATRPVCTYMYYPPTKPWDAPELAQFLSETLFTRSGVRHVSYQKPGNKRGHASRAHSCSRCHSQEESTAHSLNGFLQSTVPGSQLSPGPSDSKEMLQHLKAKAEVLCIHLGLSESFHPINSEIGSCVLTAALALWWTETAHHADELKRAGRHLISTHSNSREPTPNVDEVGTATGLFSNFETEVDHPKTGASDSRANVVLTRVILPARGIS